MNGFRVWLNELLCVHDWKWVRKDDYCSPAQVFYDDGTRRRVNLYECRKCRKTKRDETMVVVQ